MRFSIYIGGWGGGSCVPVAPHKTLENSRDFAPQKILENSRVFLSPAKKTIKYFRVCKIFSSLQRKYLTNAQEPQKKYSKNSKEINKLKNNYTISKKNT